MITKRLVVAAAIATGLLGSGAGVAAAATSPGAAPPSSAVTARQPGVGNSTATSDSPSETPGEHDEAGVTEADGPGGHQDPAGQNVDHQFNGTE